MKKYILGCLILAIQLLPFCANAQMAYQFTLFDHSTGKPKDNTSVTVDLKITDSNGNLIHSESQNAITNDFGAVSLSVGNADTFEKADWNNLPFYLSAEIDGLIINTTQIMTVPVAEYAKHTSNIISNDHLCSKTWMIKQPADEEDINFFVFYPDGTCINIYESGYNLEGGPDLYSRSYNYRIMEERIVLYNTVHEYVRMFIYLPFLDSIVEEKHQYPYW